MSEYPQPSVVGLNAISELCKRFSVPPPESLLEAGTAAAGAAGAGAGAGAGAAAGAGAGAEEQCRCDWSSAVAGRVLSTVGRASRVTIIVS